MVLEFLDGALKELLEKDTYLVSPSYVKNEKCITTILHPKTRKPMVKIKEVIFLNELFVSVEFKEATFKDAKLLFSFLQVWYTKQSLYRIKIASGIMKFSISHNLFDNKELLPFLGIHHLDFSARAYNVLSAENVRTVQDLCSLKVDFIRNHSKLGYVTSYEILDMINELKQ